MKIKKFILILLAAISISSCGIEKKETHTFQVEYKGALKNMMHKGDISAKADLKAFENLPDFYALGAMENLKGEIQIFGGMPVNTSLRDSMLHVDNSFDKKATLLVYASVSKWKSIHIPDKVVSEKQLETFIEQAAKENSLNTGEPFPFLLAGTAKSCDWHVINWKEGDTEHSHEKHIRSGLQGTLDNRELEILGFYSNSHHAIFTHHTSNMHMHVKTDNNKIAGHVDALTLGEGMMLKLPDLL